MFVEEVSDSLAFMDKVEDMANDNDKKEHWDEYNRLKDAGFKVVLVWRGGGEEGGRRLQGEACEAQLRKGTLEGTPRRGQQAHVLHYGYPA